MLHQAETPRSHSPIIVEATAAAQLSDDPRRLAAVKRYEILDTPPEADFDRITGFAADLFDVPVSIIDFVDLDRIWLKSHHGLDATEVDRHGGISALRSAERQIQAGAKVDVRSFVSAHVAGKAGLRFCIAVPLCTHDGYDLRGDAAYAGGVAGADQQDRS